MIELYLSALGAIAFVRADAFRAVAARFVAMWHRTFLPLPAFWAPADVRCHTTAAILARLGADRLAAILARPFFWTAALVGRHTRAPMQALTSAHHLVAGITVVTRVTFALRVHAVGRHCTRPVFATRIAYWFVALGARPLIMTLAIEVVWIQIVAAAFTVTPAILHTICPTAPGVILVKELAVRIQIFRSISEVTATIPFRTHLRQRSARVRAAWFFTMFLPCAIHDIGA